MVELEDKESGYKKGNLFRLVEIMNHTSTMLYAYIENNYGAPETGDHPACMFTNTTPEPLMYLGYHSPWPDRVNHFFLYQQKIWYAPLNSTVKDDPKKLSGWFVKIGN